MFRRIAQVATMFAAVALFLAGGAFWNGASYRLIGALVAVAGVLTFAAAATLSSALAAPRRKTRR